MNNTDGLLKTRLNYGGLAPHRFRVVLTSPALWAITLLSAVITLLISVLEQQIGIQIMRTLTSVEFIDEAQNITILTEVVQMLALFIVVAYTTGAQISMVNAIADGQTVRLYYGLRAGMQRLLPLLGLSILLIVPVWIVFTLNYRSFQYVLSADWGQPNGLQTINFLGHLNSITGIVGPVLIVNLLANAIGIGAERAIVLSKKPIAAALKYSGQLIKQHLYDYLTTGIRLLAATVVIWFLLIVATRLIWNSPLTTSIHTPVQFPGAYFTSPAYALVSVLQMLATVAVQILTSSIWTLVYRKWQNTEGDLIESPVVVA